MLQHPGNTTFCYDLKAKEALCNSHGKYSSIHVQNKFSRCFHSHEVPTVHGQDSAKTQRVVIQEDLKMTHLLPASCRPVSLWVGKALFWLAVLVDHLPGCLLHIFPRRGPTVLEMVSAVSTGAWIQLLAWVLQSQTCARAAAPAQTSADEE